MELSGPLLVFIPAVPPSIIDWKKQHKDTLNKAHRIFYKAIDPYAPFPKKSIKKNEIKLNCLLRLNAQYFDFGIYCLCYNPTKSGYHYIYCGIR